jgi:hypothetical protein
MLKSALKLTLENVRFLKLSGVISRTPFLGERGGWEEREERGANSRDGRRGDCQRSTTYFGVT